MGFVALISKKKDGLLSDISYILGKEGLFIDGIEMETAGEKVVVSLEVKDPHKAKKILEKNSFYVIEPKKLVIKVSNKPFSLAQVFKLLERKRIKVEDFSEIGSDSERKIFALEVDKRRKAVKLLGSFLVGGFEK